MKRTVFALTVVLMLAITPAFAQTYGDIAGTVADPSGAVIAGAAVTVSNPATGAERVVETNETGRYNVPFLSPGTYNLKAELEGFKTATRTGVLLQVGDAAQVNFALEIGALTEVVEVQAGAQMLETSSTALGQVIEQQRIVELPINGRNYLNLVKLSTNVTAEMGSGGQANSRQGGERSNQSISISGQRQMFNRFTLDGVENTDPNFNTFVVRPSVDALQEFKVQTGVYSAEFGKQSSQINVTTRSGSNEFHGTVFEFLRNDKIQARTWQQHGDKDAFRRNQFGFTATGPIVKNKLFFMANYEGFRERVSGFSQSTRPDAAMRAGDFSSAFLKINGDSEPGPIFDQDTIRPDPTNPALLTADPFPNAQIPSSRISPTFIQLTEFNEVPNVAGAVVGRDPFNYTRNTPRPLDWDQFTTRIDFTQSDSTQWFGRYSWGSESLIEGGAIPIQDRTVATDVDQIMLSNVHTFSPTLVNELRLGANIFDNARQTKLNGVRDVTGELGIPGMVSPIEAAWGSPNVGMAGANNFVSGWGETTSGPFVNKNRTYQVLDNVSWIRGAHTIKFGGEVADRRFNQIGNQFPRGNLAFNSRYSGHPENPGNTGISYASGMLGWMSEATRSLGIANVQFRQRSFALYVEDAWKVTPKLTVTVGLRYENTPPFKDRYRGVMSVKMFCPGVDDTGIDENCQLPIQVRPGDGDFHEGLQVHLGDNVPKATGDDVLNGHALVARDNNDFAPRVGVAYQLGEKTTIRTGWGMYYSQDTGNPIFDMGRNFGFRDSATSSDKIPTTNLADPWANKAGGPVECSNWDGTCVAGLYTFANDTFRRTPYIQQFLFNVQQQVTDSLMVEIGYSGNLGTKLQRMYGFNTPTFRSDPTDTTSQNDRRPWGGSVYNRLQTIANVSTSNYNALALKGQQRLSNGLTYLLGYTWAKAIDRGSGIRTQSGDNLFPKDNYNLTQERGLSQFHTAHRFTASILYDLPLRFDNNVLETVAGGWQVGSIVTFSTGTPREGGSCGDLASHRQGNRGDGTGVSPFPSNPTADQFFTRDPIDDRGPAAITCNVPVNIGGTTFNELSARQGNVARNHYISPGFAGWDFSLMKNFRFAERYNLQFRFESFNFTNHPQWNTPSTSMTSLNFGRITSARAMRTNQFALKFIF